MRRWIKIFAVFCIGFGLTGRPVQAASSLSHFDYTIQYKNKTYHKTAYVYLPDTDEKLPVLYLMHGSTGDAGSLAKQMQPLLDRWIKQGRIPPMAVVFPTYYPSRDFVQDDYSEDYPLNRFFARRELKKVIHKTESNFNVYSDREHRAFGGYSMGGVTTWEVIIHHADWFSEYLPMAGDCWSKNGTADVIQGVQKAGLQAEDLHIQAMVGENDGTKQDMIPQIDALRADDSGLFNEENLEYWENNDGSHSFASMRAELRHALPKIFTAKEEV